MTVWPRTARTATSYPLGLYTSRTMVICTSMLGGSVASCTPLISAWLRCIVGLLTQPQPSAVSAAATNASTPAARAKRKRGEWAWVIEGPSTNVRRIGAPCDSRRAGTGAGPARRSGTCVPSDSVYAGRTQGAVGIGRGAADDAVARVERLDRPARAGVDADVPRPPENIARADLVQRDFGERDAHRVRGAREANADGGVGPVDEAGAVEARGACAAPAIGAAELRLGEGDDGLAACVGRELGAGAGAVDEGGRRERARRGGG